MSIRSIAARLRTRPRPTKARTAKNLTTWAETRRKQAAATAAQLRNDGPDTTWVADLEDRLDDTGGEPGVDAALAIWADLRRRQGDAAAERIEKYGPDPEWLASLERRLDAITEAENDNGDAELVAARVWAHDGILTLCHARRHGDGDTKIMAVETLRDLWWMTMPEDRQTGDGVDRIQTGDGVERILLLADAVVGYGWHKVLKRHLGPADGVERDTARRVRNRWVAAMATMSVFGIAAMATGWYLASLVFLLAAVGCDMIEGSIGRITATETPIARTASCLIGHLAEFSFVAAIAADQDRLGHTTLAFALLLAVAVAQYATLARTSARLVGDKPSLTMKERCARFVAIAGYATLCGLHTYLGVGTLNVVAPLVTVALFGGFGLKETIRVVRNMHQRSVTAGVKSVVTIVETDNGSSQCFVNTAAHTTGDD